MPLEPQSGSRPRRLLIKSARLISPLLGILVVVAVLSGCPYVPPEVLDPPAGDFSRAMSTFAKSAREEHLASYRHEGRRDLFIKVALTTLETNWTDASLVEALSGQAPKNFLCLPNYGYERIATRLGYVEGVGSALGDRLKTPGDDIPTLFASLSTNYAIKADPKVIPETIDMWYATPAGKRCEDAANGSSADPFAYRTMGREAVPLVAGIALIDTVWTIIKPVVIGTLKSADIERRNAAVQAYFANDENVKQLGSQLSMIESWLKEQSIIEQKRAGGRAIVTSVLLFDSDAPHWQKIRQIAGTPECRENLQRLGSETTNGRGVACFDAVLAAAAAPLD